MKITSVNVKMNLKQAERFFEWMLRGNIKRAALHQIGVSLTKFLWQFVFSSSLAQIFDVPDKAAMRRLIKTGSWPPLTSYSASYLQKMRREGKVTHGSLRQHTHIDVFSDKVLFYIPSLYTTAFSVSSKGKVNYYNYGPIHERQKSILKATVVFSWQDIKRRIGKLYTEYAKRA